MIILKRKINKTQTMRNLHKKAVKKYKDTYQPETYIAGYMAGVKALFDLLSVKSFNSHNKSTGFKDKNKNEIHFGDKLRCWIKDNVEPEGGFYWYGIVEWFNGCTVVKEIGFDYSDSIFPEDYTFLFQDTEDYEIISNKI